MWNRNDLLLNSAFPDGTFYQQQRKSSQHAFIVDVLVYFRSAGSRVRPISFGLEQESVHISSMQDCWVFRRKANVAAGKILFHRLGLCVAVGQMFGMKGTFSFLIQLQRDHAAQRYY